MGDVLVCLVLHQFVNGPILFSRLLVLQPYVDEYSRQHVDQLYALELSDWDALKAIYEVLGRDVRGKEREKTGTRKKLERTRFFPSRSYKF